MYEKIKDLNKFLNEKTVKRWMFQLLKALDHMH